MRLSSWQRRYVRPEFVEPGEEPQLHIAGDRHPVLDALLDEPVVPNNTRLAGQAGPRAIIITGLNMGGKSCYIRQAALIALMAQACPSTMRGAGCTPRTGPHSVQGAGWQASPCGRGQACSRLALWWLLARLSLGSPCITQSDWCLLEA